MGRPVTQSVAGLDFAVQEPQRIALQPFPAVGAQFVMVARIVVPQPVDITGPTVVITYAVDQKVDVGQAQADHQFPSKFDNLGVHRWIGVAQHLDAELVVLAEAAGLGAFVAEDRTKIVHPDRLGQVVHPVFQVGPAHWGSAFWPEGDAVSTPVVESVHLLFDDIGALAHGPDKQLGVLERWGVDPAEAEAGGDLHGFGLYVAPVFLFFWQPVSRCREARETR